MKRNTQALLLPSLLFIVSLLGAAGCGVTHTPALGLPLSGGPVVAIAAIKPSHKPQTIAGAMIEKCPIAGCWFYVRDSTGMMKVDTKNAGFVVSNVPLKSHVVVSGVLSDDGGRSLAASGMTYQ